MNMNKINKLLKILFLTTIFLNPLYKTIAEKNTENNSKISNTKQDEKKESKQDEQESIQAHRVLRFGLIDLSPPTKKDGLSIINN